MKKHIVSALMVALVMGTANGAMAATSEIMPQIEVKAVAAAVATSQTNADSTVASQAEIAVAASADLPQVTLGPDNLFYLFKLWAERIQVAVTVDAGQKALLLEQLAQLRLAEAKVMAEAGNAKLAERAMLAAKVRMEQAQVQIEVALAKDKDISRVAAEVRADQVRFAAAVTAILAKLPADAQTTAESIGADLLIQAAVSQDIINGNAELRAEAEQAMLQADIKDASVTLQPRIMLVLQAMADASGESLAKVYTMHQANLSLSETARELRVNMNLFHQTNTSGSQASTVGIELQSETGTAAGAETKVTLPSLPTKLNLNLGGSKSGN